MQELQHLYGGLIIKIISVGKGHFMSNREKKQHLPRMCDYVSERSAFKELHDDPELITNQVTVVHIHNILMVIVSHDHHLKEEEE